MSKKTFHYSSIYRKNKRAGILKKTLKLLMRRDPTTFEIGQYTKSTRASSDISELREQGFDVICVSCGDINRFKLTEDGFKRAVSFFRGNFDKI